MIPEFQAHYKCPARFADFGVSDLRPDAGYFMFSDAVCYGRTTRHPAQQQARGDLPDTMVDVERDQQGLLRLPFNLSEVTANLRHERYAQVSSRRQLAESSSLRKLYYFMRPMLPVPVRRHLQKARLSGWEDIPFPRWPVDFSVESLMEGVMRLAVEQAGAEVPFIWFWPDGAPCCVMMTHDVESEAGRNFCGRLMDMNDAHGIKSSFQVVPEERYDVSGAFLERIRARGFEVNVHDLNHDGHLFEDRAQFLKRAQRINQYIQLFESRGFRAGAMYRRQEWFDAFDFSYDMSVPNVAHLEPQRGGCCTVMPFFIGKILELPLTMVQDYSLFHILGEYSIDRWKAQLDLIRSRNGLISFIAHPDYLIESRARGVYLDLLAHLQRLRDGASAWFALPGEVDRWWRNRAEMSLVDTGHTWTVEGPDSERAHVAYAKLERDRLVYRLAAAPRFTGVHGVSTTIAN